MGGGKRMISPLIDSLSDLKDSELETKINELQRKYFQTSNPGVKHQITVFLDIYQNEIATRRFEAARKEQEQMIENGHESVDSLINIS